MAISTFQDGEEIFYREFHQKYSVYLRLVKKWTKHVAWKSVGYESYSAADTFASATSAVSGNRDVRVIPVGGGLFDVTWTAGTVTTVYGPWYIPSPFT